MAMADTQIETLDAIAKRLAHQFAEGRRDGDEFVAANFETLRDSPLHAMPAPAEFGGSGATVAQISEVLRVLARGCPSTALAFAMHLHPLATVAWRWRNGAPVDALLNKVVGERLFFASTGGNDWLVGSGSARPVEGGYLVNGRKHFVSGSPAASLLMTMALTEAGDEVLHFGVPLSTPGIRIEETWRAMGMQGTGSHDVVFEDVFIADGAISARRPRGEWDKGMQVVAQTALPIIYSVYVGIAEEMRDRAMALLSSKAADAHAQYLAGAIDNELAAARLALADIVAASAEAPSEANTNRVAIGRTLVAKGVLAMAERVMEAAGGAAFLRDNGIEGLFRDLQAVRYHPLREADQLRMTGNIALRAAS